MVNIEKIDKIITDLEKKAQELSNISEMSKEVSSKLKTLDSSIKELKEFKESIIKVCF